MSDVRKLGFRVAMWIMAVALAGSLVFPALAQSQSAPAPKWSVLTFATVRPENISEFEGWQKELAAAYKKAGVPSRAVVQTLMGDLFEYISIYPISRFADLDGPTPMERALGKDEAEKLLRKGRAYITSAHRITSIALDDLSMHTQTSTPAPYAVVVIVELLPGKGPDFEAWVKNEYSPVLKKAEVKNYWTSRTVFGGNPDERVMVTPIDKMAAIDDGPPAQRALGKEGAQKLFSGVAGFTRSVEYRMVRYRTDLSYDMAAEKTTTAAAK